MTQPVVPVFEAPDPEALAAAEGIVAVFAAPGAKPDPQMRKLPKVTRTALTRLLESETFAETKPGEALRMAFPAGLAAQALVVVHLPRPATAEQARKAGAAVAAGLGKAGAILLAGAHPLAHEIAFGLTLRAYDFAAHRTGKHEPPGPVRVMTARAEAAAAAHAPLEALAEGVFLTRDLVNEPANILTTDAFAERLCELRALGVEVEVLDEAALAELGMRAVLAVGQGSDSPSKVVVMQWRGGAGDAAPLALVGKGVVFDSGGISIKPAAGMEDMTMDMGGAGVVAGVMHTLARRKAAANVVGLVGLVENMVSGRAQRPGDVVRSMKGDTIEVINTDAEGRLVLADVLWYAQERFAPSGVIDLATLTGAMIIALGHDRAGIFANDDALAQAVLDAAEAAGEGAWRLPMGASYDKLLKSRIADMKNVGGRAAGSITAAQFLGRFVRDQTPWVHIDIAGVCLRKDDTPLAPKGATGWGVMTLDRLVRTRCEGG